jgi:hypothetical protein
VLSPDDDDPVHVIGHYHEGMRASSGTEERARRQLGVTVLADAVSRDGFVRMYHLVRFSSPLSRMMRSK